MSKGQERQPRRWDDGAMLPPLATGEGFTSGGSGWRGFTLGKAGGLIVQK